AIYSLIKEILITENEVKRLVERIASKILEDHRNSKEINLVVVLEGAKTFCSDLAKAIKARSNIKINQHCIKVESYGSNTMGGNISLKKGIKNIAGKNLIIIEDIVDTGRTINFLISYLKNVKKAKEVKVCSLLSKPARREVDIKIDYLGTEVPNVFVVGYGLDWAGKFRELPYVASIDESKLNNIKK
ncbi:MAG: hypoxanthine phosphoribosyltransferase, partial [Candidatus Woesearchaeota archaeon]|nr:hypoxanthine phosphoribosyltransferase [Candidatus Woesearchaeota archaeon]